MLEGQVVHIPDIEADPNYTFAAKTLADFRTILAVPMLREGEAIGVLVLTRLNVRAFTDRQIETAQTFADQAAIAIENMRLFDSVEARMRELTKSLAELRATQDRLVQTEKLASLGQLTAGIAHEIKNPLNFVNNFSALGIELIGELEEALQASLANRFACPTTRLVEVSRLPEVRLSLSWLCGPLARAARAISSMRSFTLRLRSRNFVPTSPAILVIFFITRVSTRTPSPSKLESVG